MPLDYRELQEILEELDFDRRYELISFKLVNEMQIMNIRDEIQMKVKERVDKHQREYILREFEKEGVIGKLHNKFYTTVGNGTAVLSAKAFADEYAQKLIADGVDAVIMTST